MSEERTPAPLVEGQTPIEELVNRYPRAVRFLMEHGIKCLACGEPVWGTVASSAREKGFSEAEIAALVHELNLYLAEE
ncbi:MAG: DUF1858 domain-containing protein [candidate division KSB1 bacterium]|nr:DUF1858 domain-containing protein [candidate division KSB1 bacterium]MDZ7337442.1 DUF1858 domain-containing protein [candidate division KSB1 bacterium]MDZ7413158.1 DUF1858 domain-containing protein [candidate division KSB1 bacterium]